MAAADRHIHEVVVAMTMRPGTFAIDAFVVFLAQLRARQAVQQRNGSEW